MAAQIILLVILILILLVIAILSINLNIVVSFYASTEEEKLYHYAVSIRTSSHLRFMEFELYRISNQEKKKPQKKTKKKQKKSPQILETIRKNIKKFKPYIEIHHLSYSGEVAFGSADKTAIAAGSLNSAAGIFTSFLSSYASKVYLNSIQIRPIYSNDIQLNLFFQCIVKCNTGNIIFEALKNLKGSKKNVKSYKRCHGDSDEQHKRDGGCKHSDRRSCANA